MPLLLLLILLPVVVLLLMPLILFTLVVSARVAYGLWRSWTAAQAGIYGTSLVTAFGVPQSLAAGAAVLGYYLVYSAGLRWRIRNWQTRG